LEVRLRKEDTMRIAGLITLLGVFTFVWPEEPRAWAQQPSPAELIEGRVPAPPPVGVRKLDVGFEVPTLTGWPSILASKDGRWLMIGGRVVRFPTDKGKTWSRPESLSAPVEYVRRLNSGKLGGPGKGVFYTSDDEAKTWKAGGKIQAGNVP